MEIVIYPNERSMNEFCEFFLLRRHCSINPWKLRNLIVKVTFVASGTCASEYCRSNNHQAGCEINSLNHQSKQTTFCFSVVY